jgi:hypothetical protein
MLGVMLLLPLTAEAALPAGLSDSVQKTLEFSVSMPGPGS